MDTAKPGNIKKKILLISPNAEGLEDKKAYPPLGLLYVASNLGSEWEPTVKIMLDDTFTDFSYDFYGISVHSVGVVRTVRQLIETILKNKPNAKILLGGSGATLFKDTDNIVVYKGEFERYQGIDTSNLDNIRFPARELVPYDYIHYMGKVHHSNLPSTTMIATRGCVYNCAFCDRQTLGRNFRKRSVENILEEIELLQDKYNIWHIRFIDDCLTLDKKWFSKLCTALANYRINRDFSWTCLSRADCLNREILEKMKVAGCTEIFFGFESGSQKMLDLMNKRITVEKNREIIKLCKETGMKCCAYMMFGFPGEDESTVDETIKFLDETKPDKSRLSTFIPIPNTEVWNCPKKFNVSLKSNYDDFWYFDNHEFGIDYHYISNTKMKQLRNKIFTYFDTNFRKNWTR